MATDRVALLRSAEKLLRQGKLDQAIAEYRRIVDDQPRDWNTANVLGDLYLRAGQIDKAVAEYTRIADSLSLDGFLSKASALYKKILKIRPADEYVLLQAAEIAATQELLVDARAYLNTLCELRRRRDDRAGLAEVMIRLGGLDRSDVAARLAAARAQVEMGDVVGAVANLKKLASELVDENRVDQALLAIREAAAFAPGDVDVKLSLVRVLLAHGGAESHREAGALATGIADAAATRGDWAAAAATLQDWVRQSPGDIHALSRLVEIAVDGGLDDVAEAAQAQLADAHLTAGSAVEARFIAEDLVSRHPENETHSARLRRALTMLGEDPESVMASRRSQIEAFSDLPAEPEEDLSSAIDTTVEVSPVNREIDLSVVLEDIKSVPLPDPSVAPASAESAAQNIEDVFAGFREEATRRFASNSPEQELATGLSFYKGGQLDLAVPRLEAAVRSPRHRFEAAATLGRLHLERGQTALGIEWLERAAESPAPAPADAHRLMFELADALEGVGETARALAICLELRADAGDYQDVAERVERLSKVQARG